MCVAAAMVAVFLALPYLFLSTFTIFWPFDDEGTLMITFQNLLEGARLYNDAYALYGPFYYLVIGPLFLILRLPLTNDVARGVTMAFWLIDAAVLAAVVFRLTRSIEALAFAFLAGLFLLAIFSHSALHPEEICILLIGWALHLFCRIDRRPDATTFAALGSIIAGLVLTKINAGAFVALPVLLIALKSLAPRRWSSALFALVAGAGALMPFALMDPLMRFDWVVNYMLFSTVTVAAAILAWWRAEIGAAVTVRQWTVALVAMCVTAAAVIAATMLRGASAYAILYTTVLQNPGHIQNWYTPMDFERRALAAAALSAVLMAGYLASRNRASERAMDLALAWVKLALSGLGMLYVAYVALRRTPWAAEPHMLFQVLMPFCWLFIVQPRSSTWRERADARGRRPDLCILRSLSISGQRVSDRHSGGVADPHAAIASARRFARSRRRPDRRPYSAMAFRGAWPGAGGIGVRRAPWSPNAGLLQDVCVGSVVGLAGIAVAPCRAERSGEPALGRRSYRGLRESLHDAGAVQSLFLERQADAERNQQQ